MLIKGIISEDFLQYKKSSMVVLFPTCSFKCEKECERKVCQNSELALAPSIDISIYDIVERYTNNMITQAIVFGGLEPFDSFNDMVSLIKSLRSVTSDDIVIYTGYYENEISEQIHLLSTFNNIIVKFGRFIPDQKKHFDEVLGIELASDNQYAKVISYEQKGNAMAELKIRPRPILDDMDKELVNGIDEALAKNEKEFGKRFCPCSIVHTDDTVCMCKAFRDQNEPGFCHCGKYEKYYPTN